MRLELIHKNVNKNSKNYKKKIKNYKVTLNLKPKIK